MDIAQMIEQLLNKGLTETELAEEAGVAQATISRIRTGVTANPLYKTVKRIEEIYNATILTNRRNIQQTLFKKCILGCEENKETR